MLRYCTLARTLSAISIGALLAACGGGGSTSLQVPPVPGVQAPPRSLAARAQKNKQPRYTITDLGTLGGTFSAGNGLNNSASVAGASTLLGDHSLHAFLWEKGAMSDLGTLGGPNSNTSEFRVLNASDVVTGFSETTAPDPNGEDACGFGTQLICRPFVWQKGAMTPLPTLGGNNALGIAINNRGEVIGTSETRVRDACASLFLFHFKAVIWGRDHVQALAPLSGDTDTLGAAINDRGDAVGTSGSCLIARHSVLWQSGAVFDLGSLGGINGNLPSAINDEGDVVGEADLVGDTTHHAFLWRHGVMTDLGTLPGDVASSANSINNNGQVVGFSFDASGNVRGVLWQDGMIADFNTLIPASSGLFVLEALGINDRGQVAGFAVVTATGDVHAFLATPRHGGESASFAATGERPKVVLPEKVREMLLERMARWYRFRGFGV